MPSVKVQIDYKNGVKGTYECAQRPYFTYENNTAMLHLINNTTMVVNMLEVITVSYPSKKYPHSDSTDGNNL